MIDTASAIYFGILAIGVVLVALSLSDLSKAFSIWLAIYPLIADVAVPQGWEQLSPSRVVNTFFFLFVLMSFGPPLRNASTRRIIYSYFLFICAAVLSAFSSNLPAGSILRVMTYVEPSFWLIVASLAVQRGSYERSAKLILKGMLIGYTVFLAYGFSEFLLQSNVLVDLNLIQSDSSYLADVRFGIFGRLVSTLGQPVYAGLYAMVLLFVATFYFRHLVTSGIKKVLLICIISGGLGFIVFSATRAAYAGVLLFPFLYALLQKK